ncbi:alpha/beta hydrolase [Sulfuriferula sp. AH1]|uniref:alpha/beta hydrolase n=1 Tax=Sulfuriferula sp. AH1 TaxID=1985873 RepID=UPI000B3B7A5C|nr:alpha/beta fold hydrolase [Sulfuriferula sp. AH1]
MMNLLTILASFGLVIVAFHALIHWSLRAPRVVEQSTPEAMGLAYSETQILTTNDKQLYAWFIPAPGPELAPALVVLHGWGGNAETMLPLAAPLHRAGYALLFFDARSHGRSDIDTFSSMPRFAEDLDHALNQLKLLPGVDAKRIGVVGHSVGAAAALLAASRRDDLAAVVSIAAFTHPETVMRRLLAAWHVPYIPIGWYILHYVQHVIGYKFDDIAPLNTIGRIHCPVLLIHGTEDTTVPVSEAQALYSRRYSEADKLLLVSGSHDSYEDLDQQIGDMIDFLNDAMNV